MSRMNRLANITGAAALCLLLVYGCSQYKPVETTDPFMDQWKAKAKESMSYPAAPSQASQDLTKDPVAKPADIKPEPEKERPLPTKRISMTMSNVDVSVLLRALARAADVNIILNNKVAGRANINISQAPWDQVFLGILRTHNLSYSWQGDIVRIMTAEDLEEELRKEVRRRDLLMAEPMVNRIVPVKFAAADKLQENMKSFLSVDKTGKPVGSILVDQHTNSLLINAVPRDLNTILAVIEKLDKPTPQVHISAFIVEATKNVARDLGVQWGGAYQLSGGDKRGFVTGRDNNGLSQGGIGTPVNPGLGNVVNNALTDAAATSFGFLYQNVGKALLSVQLTALQDEGKINILSTPSITTLDNQMALIESGKDVPFQSVSDGEVNIQYKKAVLSLKVTPHVIDNQTLKLAVVVKKDEVDFTEASRVLGNPTIITKNAETNVIQADGQTLVIGGLNKDTSSDTQSGTPTLMDVPGLGWLFKRDGKSNDKEALLIFITPTILKVQESGATGG
ncbi:MAG TPA: type IV pilus secretin PilQ [Desulfobacterales bacterium]|nr:type IV pilus secretin PilQ [Desulfobacterales bacterium]